MDSAGAVKPIARRLLLGLLLLLPACSSWCNRKPDADKPKAPRVELLDKGREPRAELELGRWTGFRYWTAIESEGSFGIQGLPPAKAPKTTVTMASEVLRGGADPIVRDRKGETLELIEERSTLADIRVDSPDLPPEQVAALQGAFSLLRGTTTKQLVATTGEVVEVKTELVGGKKPTPEVERLLDDAFDAQRRFPFRLPPQAVGVGARWRFKEPVDLRGVRATQVAEMTLVALAERSARVGIRVRFEAGTQMIPHPLEPGKQATLEGFRGDGDGELEIDRMTAVLTAARLATTATLKISTLDAQQQRKVTTLMAASVMRIRGGVGAPPALAVDDAGADDAGVDAAQ